MSAPADPRSRIPAVDRLLASEAFRALEARWGRERLLRAVRGVLDETRAALTGKDRDKGPDGSGRSGGGETEPRAEEWAQRTEARLREEETPSLRPVINATGVVLHTNLGRAPLAPEAVRAAARTAEAYASLELDLGDGRRGSRHAHCVDHLRALTGAEDALVVNNAAAGLVLAVSALAGGRGVVVSRGELVEIGGGFRIPEILAASGVRMVEVGTTNRTRIEDYREGLRSGEGALLLKVHRSNFRVTGFVEEVGVADLSALSGERGVPLVHDVGSGLLHPPGSLGLPPEPTPAESLEAGADLVVFSGDKLLGGPQAGLVAGRADAVGRLRGHPLCRAVRPGKATLAALEATLRLHLDPEVARERIPVLRMIAAGAGEIEARAHRLAARLSGAGIEVDVREGASVVGGGTFPDARLRTALLVLPDAADGAEATARALRTGEPPVVARVEDGRVVLDLRTVLPDDERALIERLVEVQGG